MSYVPENMRKATGWLLLVALVVAAGAMICSARFQSGEMDGCGGTHGSPAVCPFLSGNMQAVLDSSSQIKQLVLALGGLLIILIWVSGLSRVQKKIEKMLSRFKRYYLEKFRDLKTNLITELISRGVLHSRAFAV